MAMAANNNPHSLTDENANNANTMSPPILRLLVVDHDPENLRLIQDLAFQCNYQVTTCLEGSHALNLLRESGGCFDVVLCDVHMPGIMDGSQLLLDHVLQEFDIPVVMMCATDDELSSAVMEGMKQKGACYNLVKPLSEQDLRNIWQNVLEKKNVSHDDADSEGTVNKRKRNDDHDLQPNTPNKKPRFVWTQERHQMFVDAVIQLGFDKAVPKRILELMDIPDLTRENVASHLQKYRLHMKKKSEEIQQTNTNWKPNVNKEANKQVCASLRVQATTNNAQITQKQQPVHHQYHPFHQSQPHQPIVSAAPDALGFPNNNRFGLIKNNGIVGRNMAFNNQNSYNIRNLLQQQQQQSLVQNNYYHHHGQTHSSSNLFQQSNYPMMAPQSYCDEASSPLINCNAFSSLPSPLDHYHNNSVSGSGSIANEFLHGGYTPASSSSSLFPAAFFSRSHHQHNLQQLPLTDLEDNFWESQYAL